MLKKIALTLVFAAALPLLAFADQAAYITKAEAETAVALLKNHKQIKHYCEPCEDKSIRTEDIAKLEAAPAGYQDFWEVSVNGNGIDLAYVYFQTKDGKWKNVARELDVKVEGVPKYLPAEKAN